MSDTLKTGERVTWTHVCERGRSFTLTVRTGAVIEEFGGYVRISFRGRKLSLRRDRVRRETEKNELTEMVLGGAK